MKGNTKVIQNLNELLTMELTAMDTYFLYGEMFKDWGYLPLFERLDHEREDEAGHSRMIIERILFLEGKPEILKRASVKIEDDVVNIFKFCLEYEVVVVDKLKSIIKLCFDVQDHGTREMCEQLLRESEEDHILYFETQLRIIDKIGLETYLSEKTG